MVVLFSLVEGSLHWADQQSAHKAAKKRLQVICKPESLSECETDAPTVSNPAPKRDGRLRRHLCLHDPSSS